MTDQPTHATAIESAAADLVRALNEATSVAPDSTGNTEDDRQQIELTLAETLVAIAQVLVDIGTPGADAIEASAQEIVGALEESSAGQAVAS